MANRIDFTDATVRRLAQDRPGSRTYSDARVLGLSMRVSKTRKVWSVRTQKDGRRVMVQLGTFPAVTVDEARAAARAEKIVAGHTLPQRKTAKKTKRGRPAKRSLEYFARHAFRYFRRNGWSKSQLQTAQSTLRHIVDHTTPDGTRFGSLPPVEITHRMWTNFFQDLQDRGMTHANQKTAASAIYRYMMRKELGGVEHNPTLGVMVKKADRAKRMSSMDVESIALFWTVTGNLPLLVRVFGRVALLTGGRIEQLARMRWEDIDWAKRMWTPRDVNGKKHQVPMPLSGAIMDELETLKGLDAKYVFPGRRYEAPHQRSHMGSPRSLVVACQADMDFQIKDLRKTFATASIRPREDQLEWFTGAGCAEDIVDILMGHATRSTRSKHYDTDPTSYLWRERLEVMEQWASYVAECVSHEQRKRMTVVG